MEKTRIAERHACVSDRVAMKAYLYLGYVTASELEHSAAQWRYLPRPGVAARSEQSHYKGVKAMHVFAHREKAGAQCVSFPLRTRISPRHSARPQCERDYIPTLTVVLVGCQLRDLGRLTVLQKLQETKSATAKPPRPLAPILGTNRSACRYGRGLVFHLPAGRS
jgi:hypothetical protein